MRRLFAALRFLTIVPLPGSFGASGEDLSRCAPMFPVVGIMLGAFCGALAWSLSLISPPLLTAACVVATMLAFSGALHMDGLSDTADGFFSSRPKERILEIMKDSRVGAMGVIAIVCTLMLKFASLASLTGPALWTAAFLAPLAGRCVMVLQMATLPYIRPGGLGSVFDRGSVRLAAVFAAGVLVIVNCGILAGVAWLVSGEKALLSALVGGLAVSVAAVVTALAFSWYCHRKIGGATGDTYGASCELGETATMIAMAMWTFSIR